MNCDQAFDHLTDPRLRNSEALQKHLAVCQRCRRMQETLEPALDLFDQLVEEPDLSAVGPLSGTASADTVRVAEQTAARLHPQNWHRRRRFLSAAMSYVAAGLLGAALMGAFANLHQNSDSKGSVPSACLWRSGDTTAVVPWTGTTVTGRCMHCHYAVEDRTDPFEEAVLYAPGAGRDPAMSIALSVPAPIEL